MLRTTLLSGATALVASLALATSPAHAGKTERAKAAIAAAEAKIQTGDTLGVGTDFPARQAEARELVNNAKAQLKTGNKTQAIMTVNRAAAIAEAAVGEAQKRKEARADVQTTKAQVIAADAQAEAQAANQHAANAETSAAIATAQAAAAQQAAANATATPQVETTVTTENRTSTPAAKKTTTKVVRKKAPRTSTTVRATVPTTSTTTTVTQSLR